LAITKHQGEQKNEKRKTKRVQRERKHDSRLQEEKKKRKGKTKSMRPIPTPLFPLSLLFIWLPRAFNYPCP
jgi:hypothetical protein